jgi:hypothetical protein
MSSRQSERGSVLILVSLSTTVLLAVAALAIDASYMFDFRDKLAAVADSAAKSAAYEIVRGNSANIVTFAQAEVDRSVSSKLIPSGVTMDAHLCNAAGATCVAPHQTASYVEVILSYTHPTFFGTIIGWANLTPRARAVAGTANPEACLITMDDLTIGNTSIDMNDCSVQVGGDLIGENPNSDIVGNAAVTGDCDGGDDLCGSGTTTDAAYPDNPFIDLVAPTVTGTCQAATPAMDPLPPGCYTTIPGDVHNLQAGVFKITGTVTIDSLLSAPSGTLLYLTSTASIIGNTGKLLVTASNTITGYEGIAIYGDPGSSFDFKNNFTLEITGAIDMVGSDVEFKNAVNIIDTGCTLFVFDAFTTKNGNGQVVSVDQCALDFGNAAFLGTALAE